MILVAVDTTNGLLHFTGTWFFRNIHDHMHLLFHWGLLNLCSYDLQVILSFPQRLFTGKYC